MKKKKIFISGPFRKKKYQQTLESIEKIFTNLGLKTFIGAKEIDSYGKIPMSKRNS